MEIQGSNDLIRIDYSRVNEYTGPEVEKKSFWQKLKHGFAKFGSFMGGMAGMVGPLFGPWGAVLGAAGYGLNTVSNRSLDKTRQKEEFDLANQSQASSTILPGFMDEPEDSVSGFVAPSHLAPDIQDTVMRSQDTQQSMIHSL